jgi:hypothetical protein
VQTVAAGTELCQQPCESVADAAVTHKAHHFVVPVAFGTSVPITEIGSRDVSHSTCFLKAFIGRSCAIMSLPRKQPTVVQLIALWLAQRVYEFPEQPRQL